MFKKFLNWLGNLFTSCFRMKRSESKSDIEDNDNRTVIERTTFNFSSSTGTIIPTVKAYPNGGNPATPPAQTKKTASMTPTTATASPTTTSANSFRSSLGR